MAKRKKGIETTKQILEESAKLFANKGYDSVSVHEIADNVGIKESSLYNHFSSKKSILDTLLQMFGQSSGEMRPQEEELDKLLLIMQPEEIFKYILFYFGNHGSSLVENIAMIINNEKYRNPQAVEIYYKYVVNEPSSYYEKLITKMKEKKMIKCDDPRLFAEQYNYISISLTKEYFMAKNGLTDVHEVVKYMVKTINFFCGLMRI